MVTTATRSKPTAQLPMSFDAPKPAPAPVVDSGKVFDCSRDKRRIESGTHFFCHTHMTARPLAEQSPDERYCQDCYDFLLKEIVISGIERGSWRPKLPSKATTATQTPSLTLSSNARGCHTLEDKESSTPVVLKHNGGRPAKQGNVSRVTKWRRRQESRKAKI